MKQGYDWLVKTSTTELVIIEGKLNAKGFQFRIFLLPFIAKNYPLHHRLRMANAPTHSAHTTKNFLNQNRVNHFKTPAQSPDLMPIELVWNDLKRYWTEELINGILKFWSSKVTIDYCVSKIDHVQRVLSQIILLEGKATGMWNI